MDHDANFRKKFANAKPQRVKADDSFVPRVEEDEMVEHLLAEPKIDDVSVDGVLNFGKDNALKDLGMGEYSRGYDYFLNSYSKGGFDSNIAPEGPDELEFGVLDRLLDEVEEVEDVHAADGLASPSEDFLLEIGFVSQASLWDYPPRGGGPNSRNTFSERQSPGLSGSSNSAIGISESSSVTIQESDCKNDFPKKTMETESRGTFKNKKRRKKAVQSRIGVASNDSSKDPNNQIEDEDDPLLSSMLINRNAKNSDDAKKVGGASRGEKRTRRPTQRYIEELSHKKSKHMKREGKKDKRQKVKSHEELYVTNEGKLVDDNKALQEPPDMIRPRRGRPKKNKLSISPPPKRDEEDFSSESEDERDVKKRSANNDRRKHQRMWTTAEVSRLVDGVSEFGVGRWTEIKRLLFAASAYRTPIDLRDKWRNLLRASSLHKLNMKQDGENQSHQLRPIPKSLIRRVNELAKVHPYPRVRGQKKISRSARNSERK